MISQVKPVNNNKPLIYNILTPQQWEEYELLDSGNGRRLERFGEYKLIRPDKQAIWKPSLYDSEWKSAQGVFSPDKDGKNGSWKIDNQLNHSWHLKYRDLEFIIQLGETKSIGVYPEQATQWDWLREQLIKISHPVNILNLFGYTGLATLTAASCKEARVTHVDASKHAISLARENQRLSNLSERPIRWIIDDALKFVRRECRRGVKYDGILMDPPKFGRGPKGEIWDTRKMLPILLDECAKILTPSPLFILITVYAVPISAIALHNLLGGYTISFDGCLDLGEIGILESSRGRILPTAVFTRWSQH